MINHPSLFQLELFLTQNKFALLCFLTAFVITMICIPPIISFIKKYKLFDLPNARKEHKDPIPTMGGIAIVGGMFGALLLWFPFSTEPALICFFLSLVILFLLGILDDLKDLSARYKFMIQLALASLIAVSGIRITSFEGLFGIHELPLNTQYMMTILAITGITNAFNLIDGIDGLAGGLAFMSLMVLGLFLTFNGDGQTAFIAFSLAGGLLAFLYFNLNPARIFMGDTGSLVTGFVIAVLCIRFLQVNASLVSPIAAHGPVFVLGIVMIPVFDTLRVFAIRIWRGASPFQADKTHIHHLFTRQGFSHAFAARLICILHGLMLFESFWLRNLPQEWAMSLMILLMLLAIGLFSILSYVLDKCRTALGLPKGKHHAIQE
jgi:UDP-N-acetylmuramyl pentapeptide phosphotransferase/UDP-N-acetylglucosamine-1-phosphate transferase